MSGKRLDVQWTNAPRGPHGLRIYTVHTAGHNDLTNKDVERDVQVQAHNGREARRIAESWCDGMILRVSPFRHFRYAVRPARILARVEGS